MLRTVPMKLTNADYITGFVVPCYSTRVRITCTLNSTERYYYYYYYYYYYIILIRANYNYISQINHVSRVYNMAGNPCLQYIVQVMVCPVIKILYFYISTFRSTRAVPNIAVFCSSLMPASQLRCLRVFWMILKWFTRCPCYDWYHLCFRIPRTLYFYCKVFVF